MLLQELQISVAGGAASGASKLPIGMLTCIDQETTEVGLTRQSTIMASSGCKSNVSNIALASGAVCLQAAHALVQCLGSCTEGGTTALMPQKQLRPFFVALLNICVSSVSNGSPGVLWCLLSLSLSFFCPVSGLVVFVRVALRVCLCVSVLSGCLSFCLFGASRVSSHNFATAFCMRWTSMTFIMGSTHLVQHP